ncbi:MAG: hypothetical protein DMF67_17490 [Acidobacteria bacterium]|nr:MAG: hypothetical protein DMF66_02545 [Acidobacteriota bacterium]PYS81248.1 MAG: hypothetical protein DMF67_17490 [Acidobacteriota bacterium]
MQDAPLQINLGKVQTLIGELEFTFVVNPEGDAHLQVYATDPSKAGKAGVLVMLDGNGYEQLKAIIKNAEGVIERMIKERRIKRMVLPY